MVGLTGIYLMTERRIMFLNVRRCPQKNHQFCCSSVFLFSSFLLKNLHLGSVLHGKHPISSDIFWESGVSVAVGQSRSFWKPEPRFWIVGATVEAVSQAAALRSAHCTAEWVRSVLRLWQSLASCLPVVATWKRWSFLPTQLKSLRIWGILVPNTEVECFWK